MLTHDDVFDVADSIVSKAIEELGSGVAIVALTGPRVRGTHTPESDLDMFYVPAQDIHASYTIVYRDILFDLFPLSWKRLEAWANYDDPRTSALVDSRVVYHRSSEDLQRFEELKATVARLQRPEHSVTMLEKASRILLDAASRLAVLDTHAEPTLTATRSEAVKTLDTMLHCLAVANQTYFSTGFGRNLEEVLALPVRPADIEKQISAIVESQNGETIIKGASSLLGSIRALLLSELFTAYYPELKGGLSKLYSARRTGNRYLAV